MKALESLNLTNKGEKDNENISSSPTPKSRGQPTKYYKDFIAINDHKSYPN
jgi:hypothetical protein